MVTGIMVTDIMVTDIIAARDVLDDRCFLVAPIRMIVRLAAKQCRRYKESAAARGGDGGRQMYRRYRNAVTIGNGGDL